MIVFTFHLIIFYCLQIFRLIATLKNYQNKMYSAVRFLYKLTKLYQVKVTSDKRNSNACLKSITKMNSAILKSIFSINIFLKLNLELRLSKLRLRKMSYFSSSFYLIDGKYFHHKYENINLNKI